MKYFVKTKKDNIKYLNNKKINNVKVKEDNISFETNEKSIKLLLKDIDDLFYINKRKIKLFTFIKKYIISIISIMIFILFLFNEQFVIKSIDFVNENTYSHEVNEYLYNTHLTKRLIYYYLNDDINTINNDLRQTFYYYEWINVKKKGNKLLVIIDKQDEKSYLDVTSNIKGDIVASRDGIIRYYFIKKGVNLIKDNQSIKKGETLITGNLLVNNNKINYIHPIGIVLAEVVDYCNIKVNKTSFEYLRTGKIELISNIKLFNKTKNNKCGFDLYEEEIISVYDYKIISKTKTIYYEIKKIINSYNNDEAKKYALSLIEKEFNENKIHKKECILESYIIEETEDKETYYFKFLIKKIINISEFKAVNLEEN